MTRLAIILNCRILAVIVLILAFFQSTQAQIHQNQKAVVFIDKVQALKDTLMSMEKQTSVSLFINHCQSFLKVIDAQEKLTATDSALLAATYDIFCDPTDTSNCRKIESYLKRERFYIISWQSPTDNKTSLAWITLPKNWEPDKIYPMYVHLHGLSDNYGAPIKFLTRSFIKGASNTTAYEDGYWLSSWGRGNLWYQGISETDVWESIAELKRLVKIDTTRQYITGHSMGGYGAWYIASRSASQWAALGVEAGALQYNNNTLLTEEVAQKLKDLPTYFVTGSNDGLLSSDKKAYNLLVDAGNTNTKFVTFEGAHEHLYSNDENLYLWMKDFVNNDYYVQLKSELNNFETNCYPNPVRNELTVTCQVLNPYNISISIFSIEGKKIESIENIDFSNGTYKLNTTNLAKGIYYFRLTEGNNSSKAKIFVKN